MVKIRKYANSIERFLHSEKGQRFFNFAFSIGAAVVIWGALFKILHLPWGSTLLCVGMGTEIVMFVLMAFDSPARDYHWEDVFPVLDSHNPDERPQLNGGPGGGIVVTGDVKVKGTGEAPAGSATIVNNGSANTASASGLYYPESQAPAEGLDGAARRYKEGMEAIAAQLQQLQETTRALNEVSGVLLESYRAITDNSSTISTSANGYVEQMADLNRNIAGLNTIYEIQLKSVSGQLDTIERVNRSMKDIRDMYEKSANESGRYCEETERMARYMKQLNSVYEKMITAMTINMYNPMGGVPTPNPFSGEETGAAENNQTN